MWVNENQCRKDIVEVGRLLYEKRILVSTDGNISIRLSENEILITSSGFCKGRITPQQITKVDMEGNILSGLKPARDIRMHLAVYRCRPEARAVVHAHPPVATGFAISGYDFTKVTLPEVLFSIGSVGITDYAPPTSEGVPQVVSKKLLECPECEALILANHGALTIGPDVMDAYYKMETLEMFLTATIVSKILGKENALTQHQVEEVWQIKNGGSTKSISCTNCGKCPQGITCANGSNSSGSANVNIESKTAAPSNEDLQNNEMKLLIAQVVGEVMKKLNNK